MKVSPTSSSESKAVEAQKKKTIRLGEEQVRQLVSKGGARNTNAGDKR